MTATPSPLCLRVAFREWFGLTPKAADLLAALFHAGGEYRSGLDLSLSLELPSTNALVFHVVHLRRALDCEAIDSEPGRGYRLTASGMAECRGALWTIGEELRGVG